MANIIDERQQIDDEIAALEELEAKEQPPEEVQAAPPEEELPEKYRNKSLNDIVRMHQEAEKAMGRHANEVGELRKVVDDFITKQTELVAKDDTAEEIDFFSDPQAAMSKAIEKHPAFRKLNEMTQKQQQSAAQAEMIRRHSDAHQIIGDEKFIEWVTASKVRQALLVKADKEYDVDAADELFSLWKERKGLVAQTATSEKNARKDTVRKAATGNNSVAAEPPAKKKFRRADIIKLMRDDPDRYASLAAEIRMAYQEGRVV